MNNIFFYNKSLLLICIAISLRLILTQFVENLKIESKNKLNSLNL